MATKTHASEQAQKSNDGGAALGEQMMKTSQKEAEKQKYNNNNQPTNEWKTKQAKDVKREENLFNLLHPPQQKIKKGKKKTQ